MALLAQTEWHGNPRPRLAYAWVEYLAHVTSPYGAGSVPTYESGVSLVPFAEKDAPAAGSIDTAGPAAAIVVSLSGIQTVGTAINWTFTPDVTAAQVETYTVDSTVGDMSPEEVITDIAGIVAAFFGADAVVTTDGREMTVTAAGANAAFTATAWSVTPA